ncbi:MAG TPA: carboxypeptidase regulatory-like domain-containing protein [Vicinamibacterales bacterium]|nr:carboxypeptidase regulatory-like domain-containing protein [Vicinamibacterales bacterium]
MAYRVHNGADVPHKLSIAVLILAFAAPVSAQQTGSISGIVVDARDGTPLEKAAVRVHDTTAATLTTEDGRFHLDNVPAGRRELYVSSVDYILVRRTVDVPAGEVVVITIPIAAGTGTYAETVQVSSGAEDDTAPSQQVLRSNELQQLRGVITNDPMRAIHVLPGVATGDDLRSEFSVRGLPVRNMNFTFEGITTPLLVHTVQGVQDTGSIAMVNGDVLNEIALAAGSYPQRYGNHTGAELNFLMREGSRDRLRGQFRPSITDTSMVLEGPLGASKSGSWLLSARKSYLGAVIKRIDPENTFAFGFHDVQLKLVRDLTSAHQVQFALTVGRSRLMLEGGSEVRRTSESRFEPGLELNRPRFAIREHSQGVGDRRFIVRDDALDPWTRCHRTWRAGRSLDAHRPYLGLAVDRITLDAAVIIGGARGRRNLSPGAGVRRSERLAWVKSERDAVVSLGCGRGRSNHALRHVAGVWVQPRGRRLSVAAERILSGRGRRTRVADVQGPL